MNEPVCVPNVNDKAVMNKTHAKISTTQKKAFYAIERERWQKVHRERVQSEKKKRETNNKNGSFIVNGKPEGKSQTHESGCVYANSMVSQASSTEYRKVNHPDSAVT